MSEQAGQFNGQPPRGREGWIREVTKTRFPSAPDESFRAHVQRKSIGKELSDTFRKHYQMFLRIASRMVDSIQEAEDVVQEALLSAVKHQDQFEGRSQLSTWITRIVVNQARMHLRSKKRHVEVSLDEQASQTEETISDLLPDLAPSPEQLCSSRENHDHLERAIRGLPEKMKMTVRLRCQEGFSTAETARITGAHVSVIKSRLRRSRERLRTQLAGIDWRPVANPI